MSFDTVHIRVLRLSSSQPFSLTGTYVVAVGSIPRGEARVAETTVLNEQELTCSSIWSLLRDDLQDDGIWVGLFHQRFFIGEVKLGSLVIPISWLPEDRLVKLWFPMRLCGQAWSTDLNVLLKLHLNTKDSAKFRAPRGELTVAFPRVSFPIGSKRTASTTPETDASETEGHPDLGEREDPIGFLMNQLEQEEVPSEKRLFKPVLYPPLRSLVKRPPGR
jgi:hypothetical protein